MKGLGQTNWTVPESIDPLRLISFTSVITSNTPPPPPPPPPPFPSRNAGDEQALDKDTLKWYELAKEALVRPHFLNRFSRADTLSARIGELKLIRWLLTTPLQFMDDAVDELSTTILLSSLKRLITPSPNHSEFTMLSFGGTAVCFKCFMQCPLYTSRREFPLELINETVCTEY